MIFGIHWVPRQVLNNLQKLTSTNLRWLIYQVVNLFYDPCILKPVSLYRVLTLTKSTAVGEYEGILGVAGNF